MLPGPCHQQGSSGDIPLRLTRRRPLGGFAEGPHCQAQRRARDHLRGPPLESSAPIGMGPDRSAPSLSAYKPRFTTARRFGPTAERRKWGMPGRNDAGSPSLFASNQKSFESFPWVPPERSSTRFSQARAGLDLRPSQELLERKKKGDVIRHNWWAQLCTRRWHASIFPQQPPPLPPHTVRQPALTRDAASPPRVFPRSCIGSSNLESTGLCCAVASAGYHKTGMCGRGRGANPSLSSLRPLPLLPAFRRSFPLPPPRAAPSPFATPSQVHPMKCIT